MIAQKARAWLPLLLLMVFFALGMTQVRYASITFDEGPHLAVGYTTLRTRDLRLQPVHIHPPLANVLAAAPLLLQPDLPDPTTIDGWESASLSAIADAVVWQYPYPARIATAGRVLVLLLSTLLGALVFRWARDLGGGPTATLALTLFALDPNLIAHGGLITTDAAAVTLSVATLYALYRWLVSPAGSRERRRFFLLSGVLLGMAQLAKVSALTLFPAVGLILLVQAWTHRGFLQALGLSIGQFLILIAIAGTVIWAGYGFEVSSVEGVPFRVPAGTHLAVYRSLNEHYGLGHPTFALGQVSDQGWWWYFPVAFLIKTPLPVLLLLTGSIAAAVGLLVKRSTPIGWRWLKWLPALLTLGLFPVIYAAASLLSSVNIGYRHLLPLLPFLYVGVAQILTRLPTSRGAIEQTRRAAGALSIMWLALGTARTLPTPLAYFNELAGGPSGGYRYLVDSNLDWGQNLWELRAWMAENGEDHVRYAHYSPANPEVYGIDADFLPPDPRAIDFTPWPPEPGLYAIGATVLQGPYAPDINTYAWFRAREPDAVLGDALFVYRVPEQPAPEWILSCTQVSHESIKDQWDIAAIRIITVDCDQTQVYASGPGLYLTPAGLEPKGHSTTELVLDSAEGTPTQTLHRVLESPLPQTSSQEIQLNGPLTLLGYTLSDQVRAATLDTFWYVTETPTRPLSLMAHLVSLDSSVVAVGDGLGLSIDQWRPGDTIIQSHTLALTRTSPAGPHEIQVGAYWLDTMERMHLRDNPGQDTISLVTLNFEGPDDK